MKMASKVKFLDDLEIKVLEGIETSQTEGQEEDLMAQLEKQYQ